MRCKRGHLEIQLLGGFGNQLFQLANALSISCAEGKTFMLLPPSHGRSAALDLIGIQTNQAYSASVSDTHLVLREEDWNCKRIRPKRFRESGFIYQPIELGQNCFRLLGYFQSYRYFSSIEEPLREFLVSRLGLHPRSRGFSSVALHARFGDMANSEVARNFHGVIDDSYVMRATKYFGVDLHSIQLITDSLVDLSRELPILYSQNRNFEIGETALEDFRTLVTFPKLIISNSSFSWWAAWIAQAETVAPKSWFSDKVLTKNPIIDLIPPNWRLE